MNDSVINLPHDKKVRHELIFSVYEKFENDKIVEHLWSFAEHIIESRKGLLRGKVVGPGVPFVPGTGLVGVYASTPAFFEDSFHIYKNIHPPVVIVWLITLLLDEINFIKKYGWSKYEDILESANCDFWDINRKSVIVT